MDCSQKETRQLILGEILRETFTPPVFLDWSRRENVDSFLRLVKSGHESNGSSYGSEKEFGGNTGVSSESEAENYADKEPVLNLDPSDDYQRELGLLKAEAGRDIKILFSTKDAKGNLSYDADNEVNVRIQASSGNFKFIKKTIEDDLTVVSFTPATVGPHSVIITVNGLPLTRSPWSVEVSPHQYKCVFDITLNVRVHPYIAVNKKTNEIAVAHDDLVLILSPDHSYVRHFRWENKPQIRSMDFTTHGSFITIVQGLSSLSLFDQGGKFIKHIGQEYVMQPFSVSVSHDGNIIVCDWVDDSIKVPSPYGTKLLQSFKVPDCQSPPMFAVYHQDMFFVSYSLPYCVKKFNRDGVFLYDIDGEGSGDGQLNISYGLAIDKFGNLIIRDCGDQRLKVFTVDGKAISTIDRRQEKDRHSGYFRISRSSLVASSNTGNLYVSDYGRVLVYQ
ncbi:E3 ubiquitin-protein ligase TRIM71-like [Stylophora pistillata]|uniref:E3 ubiquitin-protein ligase TRIM71-like n=1 Tax=Stylophora pistillata TaxID=50429 RepID=UPI000C044C82|nr:E3 ubiquitin-protein ligase TRIM71-like [Stylophora pistillata]